MNNENQIFNNLHFFVSESEKLSYIFNPSTPSQTNKDGGGGVRKNLEPGKGGGQRFLYVRRRASSLAKDYDPLLFSPERAERIVILG